MNDPVAFWHEEHANFAKLLNLLEAQLNLFHRSQTPNYALMFDFMCTNAAAGILARSLATRHKYSSAGIDRCGTRVELPEFSGREGLSYSGPAENPDGNGGDPKASPFANTKTFHLRFSSMAQGIAGGRQRAGYLRPSAKSRTPRTGLIVLTT